MRGQIVTHENCCIQPHDIDVTQRFCDTFTNYHSEQIARYIVILCQELGGWRPFARRELEAVYERHEHGREFGFHRLIDPEVEHVGGRRREKGGGWVVQGDDTMYRVTTDFVERCYRTAPVSALAGKTG